MQPSFEINDYTEKSIVVRSSPHDFLHNHGAALLKYMGKYIERLGYPAKGGETLVPGWIFPKKHETSVRELIELIGSGNAPMPTYSPAPFRGAAPTMMPSMSIISSLSKVKPPRARQMLEALLPKQGEELTLTLGENVVSITVDSVSVSSAGFVDSAVVTLPDGQNSIMKLQMKGELVWRLLGVEQEHTISLPN